MKTNRTCASCNKRDIASGKSPMSKSAQKLSLCNACFVNVDKRHARRETMGLPADGRMGLRKKKQDTAEIAGVSSLDALVGPMDGMTKCVQDMTDLIRKQGEVVRKVSSQLEESDAKFRRRYNASRERMNAAQEQFRQAALGLADSVPVGSDGGEML